MLSISTTKIILSLFKLGLCRLSVVNYSLHAKIGHQKILNPKAYQTSKLARLSFHDENDERKINSGVLQSPVQYTVYLSISVIQIIPLSNFVLFFMLLEKNWRNPQPNVPREEKTCRAIHKLPPLAFGH